MGCGRVGSELSLGLLAESHEVTVIDKQAEAFYRYPPGDGARTVVGLGFDRDTLEEAGIKEADAFIAVSSGDNSNIVSARVALEKQIQLMLFHDRREVRESLGGGDLVRVRVPVPEHLIGKPATSVNVNGKILAVAVSRMGGGFIPTSSSTFKEGDYMSVVMAKDGMHLLDQLLEPPSESQA